MARNEDISQMEERLQSILQTDERLDRFLVGSLADFRNAEGQISAPKILEKLANSERAVQNRCKKLAAR